MPDYRRGDVWIVDLKPGIHAEEPAKERPCLIVQDSKLCAVAERGTIIVIPVSSSSCRRYEEDREGAAVLPGASLNWIPGHRCGCSARDDGPSTAVWTPR